MFIRKYNISCTRNVNAILREAGIRSRIRNILLEGMELSVAQGLGVKYRGKSAIDIKAQDPSKMKPRSLRKCNGKHVSKYVTRKNNKLSEKVSF